jgi:hypothetical protein
MDDLMEFEVHWPPDPAAPDPRLVHSVCGTAVCDVEEADTLFVLAATAREHVAYGCKGRKES